MRFHLVGLILLAGVSAPVLAQRAEPVERRVDRIEQQLRAVQRRVFPNGTTQFAEPEINVQNPGFSGGNVSGDALTNLTGRVDALETQLRALTSQVEEQGYRTNQLADQVARLRTDLTGRVDLLETVPARPAANPPAARPEPEAAAEPDAPARPAGAAGANSAEEAYNVGYRLWEQRRYAEAQTALEAAATRYPTGRWISWTRNMQGRAYLDDNKPATAARILLANYQDNPRGERAADSLYYLGLALTRLNRRAEACRVYDELTQVYPNMRDFLRTRLPQARTDARCTSGADR
jgi:TolA-binding protein